MQLKDYGQARQITLFEHGRVALQILTSDFDACPADILSWLKSRWREENFLKYASENYGIDKICDYLASIETNTKLIHNPARKAGRGPRGGKSPRRRRAGARRPARRPGGHPRRQERPIPALQENITRARARTAAATARKPIPAKLPASDIDPDARTALLRAGRRGLQMVLRLLAHNAEHWLSGHLNAYLRDDDEYRAITRQTIIRGLAGTITWTPAAITVHLEPARLPPRRPRPGPAHRGDQRHPARHARRQPPHHLPPRPAARHLTPDAQPSPEIWDRAAQGRGKPETFDFLGFTHICAKSRNGRFWLKRITISKRMRAKLKAVNDQLKRRMHQPIPEQGRWLASVVRGHMAYYAVPGNHEAVAAFCDQVTRYWLKALRRRSQKNRVDWTRMVRIRTRWLPPVRVMHPFPEARFAATYPR